MGDGDGVGEWEGRVEDTIGVGLDVVEGHYGVDYGTLAIGSLCGGCHKGSWGERTGLRLVDVCSELAGGDNSMDVHRQMVQDLEREIPKWMFSTLDHLPWIGGKHGNREVFTPRLPESGFGEVTLRLELCCGIGIGIEMLH